MTSTNLKASRRPEVGGRKESRVQAWSLTGIVIVMYIVNWSDKAILGLVAQPLAKEFGLSASQIGLVGSGFFLTFTIGGFFAGPLSKLMTMRWALVLLCLVWAATMLPIVAVASFAVLLVSRLVLGLAEGPTSALAYTAVYSWHPPEKRGLPGAWITAGSSIAKIAVAPVLALVIATWGWRYAFVILAVIGVAWCGLWLAMWKEGPYANGPQSSAAVTDAEQPKVPWGKIFRTPTFLGGAAAMFAMYALVTVVLTWLPSYFEVGLGYSRVQAGTMFALPSIVSLVSLMVSSYISDKLLARGSSSRAARGVLPGAGLLFCGLALVMLPVIGAPVLVVVVVSLGYGIGSMIFPLLNAAISEICPPAQLAGALGVFLALMSLGGLVAPYLTGVIVDASSSPAEGYATSFQVFGMIAAVAAVIALITVNPERDARRLLGPAVVKA
ncbi:MFS transporter [Streptomyces sp. NPDC002896]|uniref:MFS transporter n=1 Tax=Streptomyces sp. NPDC002896 TaxID=3154438 RepID=UPI0033337566